MAKILHPLPMLIIGLALGFAARLFDIYLEELGSVFSEMAVWILIGTLIAIYSPTKKRAAANVFCFCIGMLFAYYLTAVLTHGVYGRAYIIGWTVFAFCTPVLAPLAWMSKEKGKLAVILRVGIVAVSVLSSILLFDRLRFFDLIINAVLVYYLFFKEIRRA